MAGINEELNSISGGDNGEYWIDSGAGEVTIPFSVLEIADDTVFTKLAGVNGAQTAETFRTTYNITTKTITKGNFIKAPRGGHFNSVQISSGLVKGIKL